MIEDQNFYALSSYSFEKAMLWGNCLEHWDKAQDTELGCIRVFHGMMAALEFLPIISQIVSLVEYLFAECFACFANCFNSLQDRSIAPLTSNENTLLSRMLVPNTRLVGPSLSEKFHHLCGMDRKGKKRDCSYEELVEIVKELKESDSLYLLNQVPKQGLRKIHSNQKETQTPLQYWAAKGDLEAVELLVNNGAVDCPCRNVDQKEQIVILDSHLADSALYAAARGGHEEVVQFLLDNNHASARIAFYDVLCSFIPELVFTLVKESQIEEDHLNCLSMILDSLDVTSREFQLVEIPVSGADGNTPLNCIEYLERENNEEQEGLISLLKEKLNGCEYKGQAQSNASLKNQGLSDGLGYDLEALKTFIS